MKKSLTCEGLLFMTKYNVNWGLIDYDKQE